MSVSREEPSISGDLFLVVASWFLRRSGSRVSILIACRRTVPVALSLCVNPMPSRITRKSTRPRVADRTMVDTVQPRVLARFRNRSALSLPMNMQLLRWSKAKPETTGQDTRLERHSYLTRDWMPRTITRASGGGRRMFLTSPLIEQAISHLPNMSLSSSPSSANRTFSLSPFCASADTLPAMRLSTHSTDHTPAILRTTATLKQFLEV